MSTPKSTVQSQVPDAGTPIFNQQGYIDPVWHQFFFTLLRRTGGAEGVDAGSEAARITIVEERVTSAELQEQAYMTLPQDQNEPVIENVFVPRPRPIEDTQMVSAHGVLTDPVLHDPVSQTANGFMLASDKVKLDGITAGAQPNVATNLAIGTRTATVVPITSSTGTSASFPIATGALAGVLSAADKTKLDGIATGATAIQLVGTVTSGGSVAFETGSNANGTYTKFADGTMICEGISAGPMTTSTAGGNVFHSAAVAFTYPVAFVGAVPKLSHSPLTTTQFYSWTAMEGGITATLTGTTLRLVSPVNNATGYISYIAIGRWF